LIMASPGNTNKNANSTEFLDVGNNNNNKNKSKKKNSNSTAYLDVPIIQAIIPKYSTVISVGPEQPIGIAILKLRESKIHSLPVVEEGTESKVLGLIDWHDILVHILDSLEQSTQFYSTPSKLVINRSERNPYVPLDTTATVRDVAAVLTSGIAKRVPILHPESRHILCIASASSIIKYLAQFMKLNKLLDPTSPRSATSIVRWSYCEKTVAETKLGNRKVTIFTTEGTTINAFQLMREKGIGGLPLISSHIHSPYPTANLSASDVHSLTIENLLLPVHQYLFKVRTATVVETAPAIYVTPTTKVSKVLATMLAVGIHRLYVVDEQNIPNSIVGVISLPDLLQLLLQP